MAEDPSPPSQGCPGRMDRHARSHAWHSDLPRHSSGEPAERFEAFALAIPGRRDRRFQIRGDETNLVEFEAPGFRLADKGSRRQPENSRGAGTNASLHSRQSRALEPVTTF